MQILMIGGTRFFGREIVKKLLKKEWEVTIFSRGDSRPEFWNEVETITGDRTDYADFQRKLHNRKFDVVIDNIAYNREDVEACLQIFSGKIDQYILCSTGAVYQNLQRLQPYYEEDTDLHFTGGSAYARGKREAELVLQLINPEEPPFNFTIIRPVVVEGPYDPGGRTWFWVKRIKDEKKILLPETVPSTLLRNIFSEDLAQIFVNAVANKKAFNKTYNAAGEDILTLSDYLHIVADCLNVKPNIVAVPMQFIAENSGDFGLRWPDSFVGVRLIADISEAKMDLGYQPTPIHQWMKKTVEWLLDNGFNPEKENYAGRDLEIRIAEKYTGRS